MRLTRPFVLLALAALLAPRIEASRTSVWERNPPAAAALTTTDAAGLLAPLAPVVRLDTSATADSEIVDSPRFDLGDIALVGSALEHEDRFDLGPLDLLDLNPLRGPPPSYPETRVGGFELLPPFRVGASPSLSLWSRQACGFSCQEVASDSREDPWGLCAFGLPCPGFTQRAIDQTADSIVNAAGATAAAVDKAATHAAAGAGQVLQIPAGIAVGAARTAFDTARNIGVVLDHSRPEEERRIANREIGKVVVPLLLPELLGSMGRGLFRRASTLEAPISQPRSWRDFLPEAQRRLDVAKAEYGTSPIYALDGEVPPSAVLRGNMKMRGVRPPPFPNAAHHVVAAEAEAAAPARAHLERMGIDINDPSNGVFLRYSEKGTGARHFDIHTKRYYSEVNERVLAGTTAEEVRAALADIATQLANGTFPF